MNNRLIKSNDAGGGACTNTVDLYNPFPDGGGLALYQLNGDATDVSGNYNGTATNVTYGTGVFGQAGVFDGSSRITLPSGSPFNKSNIIKSISTWIKPNTLTSRIFPYGASDDSSALHYFQLGWFNDLSFIRINVTDGSTANRSIYKADITPTTNWVHILVQVTDTDKEIYVNGSKLLGTYENTGTASNTSWIDYPSVIDNHTIGISRIDTPAYSDGSIDQVRIFNRALRPYEVEALYTEEYCTPTIVPSQHFSTITYEGNGGTQSTPLLNQVGSVDFQPDLVWIKERTGISGNQLRDSVRGVNKMISSNETSAEVTNTNVTSFDSDGFSLGVSNGTNESGQNYVAWNFKAGGAAVTNTDGTITSQVSANTEAGFSIVSYTGDYTSGDSQREIGHGLNLPPEIVIIKNRTSPLDWYFYTDIIDGSQDFLYLNKTDAKADSGRPLPNSSIFYTGGASTLNVLNNEYICYAFHSVEGFSNFGSYVGTGVASGNVVVTGFEPAMVIIKRSSNVSDWSIFDNKRATNNVADLVLAPNLSDAERAYGPVTFLENGFELTNTSGGLNSSGDTFIYMAFAADPTAVEPTLEDSFNTVTYTGNATARSITGVGFQPDFVWIKNRDAVQHHNLIDSVRGNTKLLYSSLTDAEDTTTNHITSFDADGFSLGTTTSANGNGNGIVAWNWKGAEIPAINSNGSIPSVVSANPAAGFSIVKFTVPSSGDFTAGHGLNTEPAMVITKSTDIFNWFIYHKDLSSGGNGRYMLQFNTNAENGSFKWWGSGMTSSLIGGTSNTSFDANTETIAYCFAEVAGFSKFGSYSGAAIPNEQNCGFEPAFVMIKRVTGGTGDWQMLDNKRGSDKRVYANLSSEEFVNDPAIVNFTPNGFSFNSTSTGFNNTSSTYIYMAFANQF
jgi:hypothetical protein